MLLDLKAQLDLPDSLVIRDHQAQLVRLASLDLLDKWVHLVSLDLLDNQDLLDQLVLLVDQGSQVLQVYQVQLDLLGLQVIEEVLEL